MMYHVNWFVKIPCRLIHTSSISHDKSLSKQVNILSKLVGKKMVGSKKRWFPNKDTNETLSAPQLYSIKKQSKSSSRRLTVLNKLFTKHITDLLATGSISEDIVGKGLQIIRVQVTPDILGVNVFWAGQGNNEDDKIEKILSGCAGILRHELSQLRLMGEVPRIHFVKDKSYAKLVAIENTLKKCDFGDDHIEISNRNKILTDLNLDYTDERNDDFPQMRNDVFGLDRETIIAKIYTKLKKSNDAWTKYAQQDTQLIVDTNYPNAITSIEKNNNDKELKQFLLKSKSNKIKNDKLLVNIDDYEEKWDDYEIETNLKDNDYVEEY